MNLKMVNEEIFISTLKSIFNLSKFRLKPLVLLIHLTIIKGIFGYNVAPEATYVTSLNKQPSLSYFGFSVGLLRNKNNTNWLLVGAPLANSSGSVHVKQPGAFYKCNIDEPDKACQEVILDRSKNLVPGRQLANTPFRNNAWTGAALDVDDDGNVLVCAPRWKNAYHTNEYRVTGMCYLVGQDLMDNSALDIDPLVNYGNQIYNFYGRGVYYYAHGQLGMAVHFTKDQHLLLGSPGVLNWQGSVARLNRQLKVPAGGISRREASFLYSSSIVPNPIRTSNIHDNNFFGYSVTSGKFNDKDKKTSYVGGAPRGASANGMVLIYFMKDSDNYPLNITDSKEGIQFGEYFGASVAAPDLNGDGLSDLVVGAPLHSTEGVYDVGCIYVYNSLANVGELESNGMQLFGDISQGARFGLALGTPGDLDKDGYEDLLIGAPYEKHIDELDVPSGAVYVFMGSINGVRQKYLQKLVSKTVSPFVTLKGFGISFSRPLDVDENTYPDFAVGSFLSDKAVLMSTRPVIIARGELSSNPTKLSLEKNFFTLTTCLSYEGEGFTQIAFVARVFLSQELENGEIFVFFSDSGSTERIVEFLVPYNEKKCQEFKVDLKLEKSNAQNPVIVRMDFEFKDKEGEGPEIPVLSPFSLFPPRLVLSFVTGCGEDGCNSNLVSTARIEDFDSNSKLLIGKIPKITLIVETWNKGEPAFLPNITINIPKPIVVHQPSMRECVTEYDPHITSFVCQLKNPLKNYEKDEISLDLNLSQLDDSTPDIQISVSSKSSADVEENPEDNQFVLELIVEKNASISVSGYSVPEQIIYERITEDKIKPNQTYLIKYSISVSKSGFTPLRNVEVEISLPRNVTLRTGESITMLQELEVQVFHSQSYICSQQDSDIKLMYRDPNVKNISDDNVIDRGLPKLSMLSCLEGPWGYANCSVMKCIIGPMKKANDVAQLSISFKVNSTVNISSTTLVDISDVISVDEGFNILSFVNAKVTPHKLVSSPKGNLSSATEIQTLFVPGSLPAEPLALWIYLVAILCGLLLLLIIAFILYKVGFFKRKAKEELKAQKATLLSKDEEAN